MFLYGIMESSSLGEVNEEGKTPIVLEVPSLCYTCYIKENLRAVYASISDSGLDLSTDDN